MKNPNNFNDIENLYVQAYNRAMTAQAINQEDGPDATRVYFEQFSEEDRKNIGILLMAIKVNPQETYKRIQAIISETYN